MPRERACLDSCCLCSGLVNMNTNPGLNLCMSSVGVGDIQFEFSLLVFVFMFSGNAQREGLFGFVLSLFGSTEHEHKSRLEPVYGFSWCR